MREAMKRWWLWIILLLSLGVNAGILLTLAVSDRTLGPEDDPRIDSEEFERNPGRSPRSERRPDGERPNGERPNGERGEARILERLAERFGLEGETRERFMDLQRGFFRQAFESRQQGRRLQRELGVELSASTPDRQRIDELIDELAENRRELDRALAESVLETRALLDEPHESEYLDFLHRLRERMGRDGPGGPRRRPRGDF